MKFKKLDEPVVSSDLYYDLFEGGYLEPKNLLKDKKDVKAVEDAIALVKKYLEEAQEAGSIEVC